MKGARSCVAATVLLILFGAAEADDRAMRVAFNIPAQPLDEALTDFAQATGLQLLVLSDIARERTAPTISGSLSPEKALEKMLADSGLRYQFVNERTVAILGIGEPIADWALAPTAARAASEGTAFRSTATAERDTDLGGGSGDSTTVGKLIPEVLVKGSRSLNMDIRRSEDDIQPYVVFDRAVIEKSGASDIQELLRTRLTSVSDILTPAQATQGSNKSLFSLRGLDSSQTLILVDGRRLTPQGNAGDAQQPDVNGIPLSAIERIEVLPTTASGIYGGGATGGVINIILRRDYRGLETKLTYDNSFEGGGTRRRVDFAGGADFEGGKTNLLVTGSYSTASDLLVGDRGFVEAGRASILANNPGAFTSAFAPPLGTTTNICSAIAFSPTFAMCDGAPLVLKNGTSLGATNTFVPSGYGGVAADNGNALIANAGRYNLGLANTSQVEGGRQAMLNSPTVTSVRATLRRDMTANLHALLEVSGSKNEGMFTTTALSGAFVIPASSPANPFQQDIQVTTPTFGVQGESRDTVTNRRVLAGLIFDLPRNWRGEADYTWERNRNTADGYVTSLTNAAFDAVGNGTINVLRDTNQFPVDFSSFVIPDQTVSPADTTMNGVTLRLGGPLGWELPGGAPSITFALEHRKDSLGDFIVTTPAEGPPTTNVFNSRSQKVDSAYLEARLPIVSSRNRLPGVELLELQLSGRWDRYRLLGANSSLSIPGIIDPDPPTQAENDFTSTDPTVGFRFQPISDITLRASYGTGFLPPALNQLVPTQSVPTSGFGLTDPRRGDEPVGLYTVLLGGNPDLRPEQSQSRAAGLVLTPRFVPNLRASIDWLRIRKRDNTLRLFLTQDVLNNEQLLPEGLIVRGPASDGFDVGPISSVSVRPYNVARTELEAWDFSVSYRFDTIAIGAFQLSTSATRNVRNETQVLVTLPSTSMLGTLGSNKWMGSAALDWDFRQFSARWNSRYYDAYWLLSDHSVLPNQGSASVPSQLYHDVTGIYRLGTLGGGQWAADTEMQVGIRNVFNKAPPLDMTYPPYYSSVGDPRLRSYYLSLKIAF